MKDRAYSSLCGHEGVEAIYCSQIWKLMWKGSILETHSLSILIREEMDSQKVLAIQEIKSLINILQTKNIKFIMGSTCKFCQQFKDILPILIIPFKG